MTKNINGKRPNKTSGMRHVALFVPDLEKACFFYIDLLGMSIEWQPDNENIFLCSGNDNVALHKKNGVNYDPSNQRLDHIGFIIDRSEEVDEWYNFFCKNDVLIKAPPRTHRDGARSFYCLDPAGTLVQLIYHPPISST
tara:strand:+ start:24 stop:440 length:417 start_codon:yes stop_codon:yes gene_type:complete